MEGKQNTGAIANEAFDADGEDRQPFEPDPTITVKAAKLMQHCDTLERGHLIHHETIEALIDETRYVGQWFGVMERFRKDLLRERGIALHSERSVGYYLATPEQQVFIQSETRVRRAMGQGRRMQQSLEAIDTADLTDHQGRARAALVEEAAKSRREARLRLRVLRRVFRSALSGDQDSVALARREKRVKRKDLDRARARARQRGVRASGAVAAL